MEHDRHAAVAQHQLVLDAAYRRRPRVLGERVRLERVRAGGGLLVIAVLALCAMTVSPSEIAARTPPE
jgi:hypothetical protein